MQAVLIGLVVLIPLAMAAAMLWLATTEPSHRYDIYLCDPDGVSADMFVGAEWARSAAEAERKFKEVTRLPTIRYFYLRAEIVK